MKIKGIKLIFRTSFVTKLYLMKNRKLFLILFLCLISGLGHAQNPRLKYFGLEAGSTFFGGEMTSMDFIRSSTSSYHMMDYSADNLSSFSNKYSLGLKLELMSLNDRFGLLSGLRYSRISSTVEKSDYWFGNSDFFYWLYRQEGVDTEYLRVRGFNQYSDYLGIPIELRYYTGSRPRRIQFYLKVGMEINFLMASTSDVDFYNSAMSRYEDDLTSMLKKPKAVNTAIYGGGGFKFGRDQKPSISVEAFPYVFLSSKHAGIVEPSVGGGFQVSYQLPIKPNH